MIFTNFCDPKISGLGRHQSRDSGFGIPGLQSLTLICQPLTIFGHWRLKLTAQSACQRLFKRCRRSVDHHHGRPTRHVLHATLYLSVLLQSFNAILIGETFVDPDKVHDLWSLQTLLLTFAYNPHNPLSCTKHYCLSNAMHSIGQSIKSPLCPCVRASVHPCVRASNIS